MLGCDEDNTIVLVPVAVESDAIANRQVYKVTQQLEEVLGVVEKNLSQVEIAELKVKGNQSCSATKSNLITTSSLDSAADCKPEQIFFVGHFARTLPSAPHAGKFLAKLLSPILPSTTTTANGNSTVGGNSTDMCVRQYAVVLGSPGQYASIGPRQESCSLAGFGLPMDPLQRAGTSRQSELDPGWPLKRSLSLPLDRSEPKDSWEDCESLQKTLRLPWPSHSARRKAEAHESRNFVHRRRETQRNKAQPEDDNAP